MLSLQYRTYSYDTYTDLQLCFVSIKCDIIYFHRYCDWIEVSLWPCVRVARHSRCWQNGTDQSVERIDRSAFYQ